MHTWTAVTLTIFGIYSWPTGLATEFNLAQPQQQIIDWAKLNILLEKEGSPYKEACTATPEQTIARYFLENMFSRAATLRKGILETVLPRAKYYAAQIAPLLTRTSEKDICQTKGALDYKKSPVQVVCYESKCTSCDIGRDEENKTELIGLCKSIKKLTKSDPEKQPEEPEMAAAFDNLKLVSSKSPVPEAVAADFTAAPSGTMEFEDFVAIKSGLEAKTKEMLEMCEDKIEVAAAAGLFYMAHLKLSHGARNDNQTFLYILEQFPEFANVHFSQLKTRMDEVTCKWGTFCGPDGFCTDCEHTGVPAAYGKICFPKKHEFVYYIRDRTKDYRANVKVAPAANPSAGEKPNTVSVDTPSVVEEAKTVLVEAPSVADVPGAVSADNPSVAEETQTVSVDAPSAVDASGTVSVDAPSAVDTSGTVSVDAPSAVDESGTVSVDAPSAIE